MHDFVNWSDVPMLLATGGMLALAGLLVRGLLRLTLRKVPPVGISRGQAWAFLVIGAAVAAGFAWMAAVQFEDPWALSEARRSQGAHQWSLGVMFLAGAFFCSLAPWLGVLALLRGFEAPGEPDPRIAKFPPVSLEERNALLAELASDALWAKGYAAVAAHVHLTVLCATVYAEEQPSEGRSVGRCAGQRGHREGHWNSDEPIWEALEAELQRRFASDTERKEAARTIDAEYSRLVEEELEEGQ